MTPDIFCIIFPFLKPLAVSSSPLYVFCSISTRLNLDLVIALSCPFGICSLMRPFSDRHHDEVTVSLFSFLSF